MKTVIEIYVDDPKYNGDVVEGDADLFVNGKFIGTYDSSETAVASLTTPVVAPLLGLVAD